MEVKNNKMDPNLASSNQSEPASNATNPYGDGVQRVSPSPTSALSTETPVGLTGSQLQPERTRVPFGIYIIAGFNLLAFVASFFDSSQNSGIYSILMLINLLIAVGLLFRLEVARKVMIWLAGLTLVLVIASVLMLVSLQQRLSVLKSNYEEAISRIDQTKLTSTQKQQLDSITADIAVKEKQAGKAISFTYIKLSWTGIGTTVMIIYLMRPKVKDAFHHLEV